MIGESASGGGVRSERRGRGRAGEAEFAFPLAVSGQERAGQGGVGDVVGQGLLAGKRRVALAVVRAEPGRAARRRAVGHRRPSARGPSASLSFRGGFRSLAQLPCPRGGRFPHRAPWHAPSLRHPAPCGHQVALPHSLWLTRATGALWVQLESSSSATGSGAVELILLLVLFMCHLSPAPSELAAQAQTRSRGRFLLIILRIVSVARYAYCFLSRGRAWLRFHPHDSQPSASSSS